MINPFRRTPTSYKRQPGESFRKWSNRCAHRAKFRAKLIWDVVLNGPYVREKHGEIGERKSEG